MSVWEHLPEGYRDNIKPLWEEYNLFTLSGAEGRLGGGKKDISMLFTYSSVANYLEEGGKLGFVITQSIFKTQGAGDGFRQLRYTSVDSEETWYLKPLMVHDLSATQVPLVHRVRGPLPTYQRLLRAFRGSG